MQALTLRLLFFMLLPLAGAACSSNANAAAAASPTPAPHVMTVRAEHGSITPTLTIAGVIAPYRQVGVTADLTEPIADVAVQEGDRVVAGQLLARLLVDDLQAQLASAQRTVAEDVARFQQYRYQTTATNAQDVAAINSARASLHQAQVALRGARTDLARYVRLASQGYLPAQTVDEQRTTVASDVAAVNAAQASLNQAVANNRANGSGGDAGIQFQQLQGARAAADAAQASVEQLRRQIARAVIVAPVTGVIESVNANPGEYPTSRQLFTIEQTADMYAILPASTAQVVDVRPGASTSLTTANGTRRDSGKVVAVLDQIQPGTTNFTVKVLVANPDGHLHAGIPVTGVVDERSVSGVEVPVTAFVDDTRESVYVVENGVVKTHKVAEVKDDGKHAIVTGLDAGSSVVADVSNANIGNGDHVAMNTGK